MEPKTNERERDFINRCVANGYSQNKCKVMFWPEKRKQIAWKKIDQRRRGFITFASKQFRGAIEAMIDQARSTFARYQSPSEIGDIELGTGDLQKAYEKVWPRVGAKFAAGTVNAINKNVPVTLATKENVEDMSNDDLESYFNTLIANNAKDTIEQRVRGVSQTVKQDIKNIIAKAIDEGASIDKTGEMLEDIGKGEISPKRGRRIARTEVVGASNFGSLQGAKATGLELQKEYIATRDGRTRAGFQSMFDHLSPDGQIVDKDEFFEVSGEQLKYPGDPAGSPGNIINCRCTMGFRPA